MDTKKYFTELSRILGKNGIETAPPEKDTLPILIGTWPAGRETQHGDQFVTWECDYDETGVMWRHYYLDNHSDEKQDFAI